MAEAAQQIIFNTCPDEDSAQMVANRLVMENLAACVNIVPGLTSIYKWDGEIQQGTELLLMIKTRDDLLNQAMERIAELHPYELPEIISVPIDNGLQAYLDWIDNSTGKP